MYKISEVWSKGDDKVSVSYQTDNPNFGSEWGYALGLSGYVCTAREVEKVGNAK